LSYGILIKMMKEILNIIIDLQRIACIVLFEIVKRYYSGTNETLRKFYILLFMENSKMTAITCYYIVLFRDE